MSSTLGSCLSTSRMAASRFLSGNGESALADCAQAARMGRTKTTAIAAGWLVWESPFHGCFTPTAQNHSRSESQLDQGSARCGRPHRSEASRCFRAFAGSGPVKQGGQGPDKHPGRMPRREFVSECFRASSSFIS